MKHRIWATLAFLALISGCGAELETGYKPQKLGVTSDERRAYYAPAFSPEQQAGLHGEEATLKARRPNR